MLASFTRIQVDKVYHLLTNHHMQIIKYEKTTPRYRTVINKNTKENKRRKC